MGTLLNREQVASYLSVSPVTVDRLRSSGKLNSFKIGNREGVRFREEDVRAYVEQEIAASKRASA
jgi:excisionase family DNA binding protein